MNGSTLDASVLLCLFRSAREGEQLDLLSLAERLGATPYAVLVAGQRLAERGCLDARRLRLTFRGLATAAALAKDATQSESRSRRSSRSVPSVEAARSNTEPAAERAASPEECAAFFNQAASQTEATYKARRGSKRSA